MIEDIKAGELVECIHDDKFIPPEDEDPKIGETRIVKSIKQISKFSPSGFPGIKPNEGNYLNFGGKNSYHEGDFRPIRDQKAQKQITFEVVKNVKA